MDFLTAEISKKRKENELVASKSSQKYFKRGDLEKEREKAYYEEKKKIDDEKEERLRKKRELLEEEENKRNLFKERYQKLRFRNQNGNFLEEISEEELIKKLRDKNQPICLFGESFDDRKKRLSTLELIEEQRKKQENKSPENLQFEEKNVQQSKNEIEELKKEYISNPNALDINLNEFKTNPDNVYIKILVYFETLIELWKKTLDERPDDIKESKQGKSILENQQKSQKDLQVFFNLLRKKTMKNDILEGVSKITYYCQRRQYVKANDAYLQLSIGNAAWPIGVTMVGIHERSAREKLHKGQTGHVLNDEATRKWLQAIKRLLTFIQSVKPPDDRNQLMG
ncbi:mRNA splicing protein PRP18 [Pneumocystis jirovecii RU7]|uniref:Pre-mRNA-splicing factor 18 n=1 Tax=Pneumocystis jirovecii (strain RU7) TaxID=1408657 RepID=A0A0W4ZTQ9_PNEJ7|nr:mRNA splicing protein PRP18 [Pneumocystis jirovecii RU7]KTW31771.1 hypothetical protein T551_01032 [Pneumocystis jirovecii RU7]